MKKHLVTGALVLSSMLALSGGMYTMNNANIDNQSVTTTAEPNEDGVIITSATNMAEKPVIYVYNEKNTNKTYKYDPEFTSKITLELDGGELGTTYPAINPHTNSWEVTAYKGGTLIDKKLGLYDYIFWDGEMEDVTTLDVSKGFCVKGEDTASFLEEKLAEMGMNFSEIEDFITYWLPRMEKNPYNVICFQDKAYTNYAKLTVTPEPDGILRVFMAWYPVEEEEQLEPQTFEPFDRGHYCVVEWGGIEINVERVAHSETTTREVDDGTTTKKTTTVVKDGKQ